MATARRLRVLVVEDDPVWRDELGMMYCRLLRRLKAAGPVEVSECQPCLRRQACLGQTQVGETPRDNLHPDIALESSGSEAIRRLQQDRNCTEVLSLDINMSFQHSGAIRDGAHGLDVLDVAFRTQDHAAVVVVTAAAYDSMLPGVLTVEEDRRVRTLQAELQERLPGAHYFHHKRDPRAERDGGGCPIRAVAADVRALESVFSYERLTRMVNAREEQSRQSKAAPFYCQAYVLPDSCFIDPANPNWKMPPCIPLIPTSWQDLTRLRLFGELHGESDFDAEDLFRKLRGFKHKVFGALILGEDGHTIRRVEPISEQPTKGQLQWLHELALRFLDSSYLQRLPAQRESKDSAKRKAVSLLNKYLMTKAGGVGELIRLCPETHRYRISLPTRLVALLCSHTFLGIHGAP